MNVFEELAELYFEIDQSYSAQELELSIEEPAAPVSRQIARKRELNDHAYFLFMFTRFEDHVREESSRLIRQHSDLAHDWTHRRVWAEILRRVAHARLVIDSGSFGEATLQEALAEQFVAQGIERERLAIGCHSPPWDVLRGIDIGLDCFPHNSGTTLFETLYMGVPFITLAGRPSVGRLGSTILTGVGHPEWITHTEEEYVEKAVALATDLSQLATLRAGLRQEMEQGPLMDEAGFARKVESAYQAMFRHWHQSSQI